MAFGLNDAPFTFQRLMYNVLTLYTVLKDENWLTCLIYLDDLLILSKNFSEHISRLAIVLSKIKESGLKFSPAKCNFFLKQSSY